MFSKRQHSVSYTLTAILAAVVILSAGCGSSSDNSGEDFTYTPTIDTAIRTDIENVYTAKGKIISGKESSQNPNNVITTVSTYSGTYSGSSGTSSSTSTYTSASADSDSILVKEVFVSVGDKVQAGDVLYTIDTSQIAEDLATAEQKQALNDQQNALTQATNQRALADAQADSADSYRDSDHSLNRGADDTNKAIAEQLEDDQYYQQYLKEEEEKKAVYDDLKAQVDNLQEDVYTKQDLVTSLTRQRDARANELGGNVTTYVPAADTGNSASEEETTDNSGNGVSDSAQDASAGGTYVTDETYRSLSNQLTQATYDLEDVQTALTRKQSELSVAQTDYDNAKSNRESYESKVKSDAEATESAKRSLEDQESTVNRSNRSAGDAEASAANAIASQNITKALADLDSQAEINKLKERLENDKVIATMDGTVTAVNVAAGQYYNGSDAVVLDNLSKMKVSADIDEKYIADLNVGTKVRVKTDATGDDVLNGEVTFASPTPTSDTVSQTSGTSGSTTTSSTNTSNSTARAKYKVEITLDDPNDRLRIGMTASIDFIIASASNVVAVPNTALTDDGSGSYYLSVVTGSGSSGSSDAGSTESSSFIASDGSTIGWTPIDDSGNSGSTGSADLSESAVDGGTIDVNNLTTEEVLVTTGVTDGTWTEITSGNIQEGEQMLDQSASGGSGDYSSMTDGMYSSN